MIYSEPPLPSQGMPRCLQTERSTVVISGFDKTLPSARPVLRIDDINAQSPLGHFFDIEMPTTERYLDILSICETWLHLDRPMFSTFIKISDFSVYRYVAGLESAYMYEILSKRMRCALQLLRLQM